VPPERCLTYIQQLLGANIATNREMLAVTSIIVREQTHPTQAFSILYDGVLERLHRLGARLIATYVGADSNSRKPVVQFHALLGESLAFRFARETIIRRAGWTNIGLGEESMIESVVTEHAELVLRGLRERDRRDSKRNRPSKTKKRKAP
jgi:hypothetical protein